MSSQPRGIRNNNPLNIKRGSAWIGRCVIQNDPVFVQFKHIKFGLRAAFIILRKYLARGLDTPEKIIRTWAPDGKEKEDAYIKSVCNIMDVKSNTKIEEPRLCALVYAMARVECGEFIDIDVIRHAYKMKV